MKISPPFPKVRILGLAAAIPSHWLRSRKVRSFWTWVGAGLMLPPAQRSQNQRARVIGVDRTPEMIEKARQMRAKKFSNVNFDSAKSIP